MSELILIIEYDDLLRSNLFDLLELENFNVVSAKNGFTGLKIAQELQPNLIICDVDNPRFDRQNFLIFLRENSMVNKIPFIFLTSERELGNCFYSLCLYAKNFLIKPLKLEKLLEVININLNNQKIEV